MDCYLNAKETLMATKIIGISEVPKKVKCHEPE